MLLVKDNKKINLTDEFVIGIYKTSGWEELKETPKKVEKTEEVIEETEPVEKNQSKKEK